MERSRAVKQEGELLRKVTGLVTIDRLPATIRAIRSAKPVQPRLKDSLVHLAVARALELACRDLDLTNDGHRASARQPGATMARLLATLSTIELADVTRCLVRTVAAEVGFSQVRGVADSGRPVLDLPSIDHRGWTDAGAGEKAGGLVLFGVDGVRKDIFDAMLSRGLLPHIKRHILNRGLTVDRLVSSFPTVTPPCAATMLTGVRPDRHLIPALAWYDRESGTARLYTSVKERVINTDLGPAVRTIWERLKPAFRVATIGMPVERGADARWFHVFYPDRIVTRLGLRYLGRRAVPSMALALWYLDADTASHLRGTFSQGTEAALETFDRQVGRVVDRLRANRTYERTLLVLISDHGSQPTVKNVDVFGELNRLGLGLKTLDLSIDPFFPQAMRWRFARSPVVGICLGAGTASLYLEKATKTSDPGRILRAYPGHRGPIDLIGTLLACDGVDVVMHRAGANAWRVTGREGTGEIRRGSPSSGLERRFRYDLVSGDDPLEVARTLRGRWLEAGDWDLRTASSARPGAVPGIACFLASGRAGDLTFCSRPGYNFSKHFHCRGGYHGALSQAEMVTRLVMAGPRVPRARIAAASMADVTPTLLTLLGIPYDPAELDGRSLVVDRPMVGRCPP